MGAGLPPIRRDKKLTGLCVAYPPRSQLALVDPKRRHLDFVGGHETDNVMAELRPPMLDDYGLPTVLE
ncbi:MAG: hypothetical protein R3C14_02710 [Caldilineaceae bacterium]